VSLPPPICLIPKDEPLNLFDRPTEADTAAVDAAMTSRHSMRAFLPTPVPRELLEEILGLAARAPSGTNTKPWPVHGLAGAGEGAPLCRGSVLGAQGVRKEWCGGSSWANIEGPAERALHERAYDEYPKTWESPYLERRRKVGWDLYGLLGIAKDDKTAMHHQHARNYRFFGAPVGLFFSIDRHLAQGSWLDYGMFLQSIMLAARARGLHTCPQAAFTQFHRIIAEALAFRPEQMLVCGMALGYADPSAVENSLVTERANVSEFARFLTD